MKTLHSFIALVLSVVLIAQPAAASWPPHSQASGSQTVLSESSPQERVTQEALLLGGYWFRQAITTTQTAFRLRRAVPRSLSPVFLRTVRFTLGIAAAALSGGALGLAYIDDVYDNPTPRTPAPQTPNFYKNWLEFVGDNSPDWQRFNLLGAVVLQVSAKNDGGIFTFDQIKQDTLDSFENHLLPANEEKIQSLLSKMVELHLVRQDAEGRYAPLVEPEVIAVKTENVAFIQRQLEHALRKGARDGVKAETHLYQLLEHYARIVERWKLDPLEARWPVLKAVARLSQADQTHLLKFLDAHADQLQHWPLMGSMLLMLRREFPPDWLLKHAPHMVGRNHYIVGSEGWYAAGGLGRVLQYNAAAIQHLAQGHMPVITIEPYYSHWLDGQRKLHQGLRYGPGGPLITPVEGLSEVPVMSFEVEVNHRQVLAEVFEGTNEYGVKVYLIRDRQINPANGETESLITRVVYNYRETDKLASDEAISTAEEFTEFMSRASLKLIQSLEEKKQEAMLAAGDTSYKAPVISVNDGQFGPFALFKRDLDRVWKALSGAVISFVTHTYRNRMWFRGVDSSSMGAAFADFVQCVASIHRQEKAAPADPDIRVVANTNGDNRALTRRLFLKLWTQLFGHAHHEHPSDEQIRKLKYQAKKQMRFDRTLLESLGIFRADEYVLDPDKLVLVFTGRLDPVKAGRERALTDDNIRLLVSLGVQVVIYGNIQATTKEMYDDLVRLAKEVNQVPEGTDPKTRGKLIVRSGWGQPEQIELLAAADVLVVDSDRGTEAAGISETDGMATGCIIVGPAGLEGILQKQGLPINRAEAYSGNTAIPEESTQVGYAKVYQWLLELYEKDPVRFASYQAASVRLSRILEAELPAAENLRQYDRAVQRKDDPLYLLTEIRQRLTEADKYLWSYRVKTELLNFLASSLISHSIAFEREDIKTSIIRLENGEVLLLAVDRTDTRPSPWGEKKFGRLLFNASVDAKQLQELLGVAELDPEKEFIVADAATGEIYGQHKIQKILEQEFKVGVPVGKFQMLQFLPVTAPTAEGETVAEKSLRTVPASWSGNALYSALLAIAGYFSGIEALESAALASFIAGSVLFVEEYLYMKRRGLDRLGWRDAKGAIGTVPGMSPFRARRVAWHEKLVHAVPGGAAADFFVAPFADWAALALAALGFTVDSEVWTRVRQFRGLLAHEWGHYGAAKRHGLAVGTSLGTLFREAWQGEGRVTVPEMDTSQYLGRTDRVYHRKALRVAQGGIRANFNAAVRDSVIAAAGSFYAWHSLSGLTAAVITAALAAWMAYSIDSNRLLTLNELHRLEVNSDTRRMQYHLRELHPEPPARNWFQRWIIFPAIIVHERGHYHASRRLGLKPKGWLIPTLRYLWTGKGMPFVTHRQTALMDITTIGEAIAAQRDLLEVYRAGAIANFDAGWKVILPMAALLAGTLSIGGPIGSALTGSVLAGSIWFLWNNGHGFIRSAGVPWDRGDPFGSQMGQAAIQILSDIEARERKKLGEAGREAPIPMRPHLDELFVRLFRFTGPAPIPTSAEIRAQSSGKTRGSAPDDRQPAAAARSGAGKDWESQKQDFLRRIAAAPTEEDLKHVYRAMAVEFHPDKNLGDPRGAEEIFKQLCNAIARRVKPGSEDESPEEVQGSDNLEWLKQWLDGELRGSGFRVVRWPEDLGPETSAPYARDNQRVVGGAIRALKERSNGPGARPGRADHDQRLSRGDSTLASAISAEEALATLPGSGADRGGAESVPGDPLGSARFTAEKLHKARTLRVGEIVHLRRGDQLFRTVVLGAMTAAHPTLELIKVPAPFGVVGDMLFPEPLPAEFFDLDPAEIASVAIDLEREPIRQSKKVITIGDQLEVTYDYGRRARVTVVAYNDGMFVCIGHQRLWDRPDHYGGYGMSFGEQYAREELERSGGNLRKAPLQPVDEPSLPAEHPGQPAQANVSETHTLSFGTLTVHSARETVPGLWRIEFSVEGGDVRANHGVVLSMDPGRFRIEPVVSRKVLERNFDPRNGEPLVQTPDLRMGYTVRDMAEGRAPEEDLIRPAGARPDREALVLAVPATDNILSRNALLGIDGKLVARPKQAVGLTESRIQPPMGWHSMLSLDPNKPVVFKLRLSLNNVTFVDEDGATEATEFSKVPFDPPLVIRDEQRRQVDKLPVRNFVSGQRVVEGGRNVAGELRRDPETMSTGDSVNWGNVDEPMAFSLNGYTRAGRLGVLQVWGNPDPEQNGGKAELNIKQAAEVALAFGFEDAILGAASGGVYRAERSPQAQATEFIAEGAPGKRNSRLDQHLRVRGKPGDPGLRLGAAFLMIYQRAGLNKGATRHGIETGSGQTAPLRRGLPAVSHRPAEKSLATVKAAWAGSAAYTAVALAVGIFFRHGEWAAAAALFLIASSLLFGEEHRFMSRTGLDRLGQKTADGATWIAPELGRGFRARRVAWHEKLVHAVPGGAAADFFVAPFADWLALALAALGFEVRMALAELRETLEAEQPAVAPIPIEAADQADSLVVGTIEARWPLEEQKELLARLVPQAAKQDVVVVLQEPLAEGLPMKVTLTRREWTANASDPFSTLMQLLESQEKAVDGTGSGFFKIYDDGQSLETVRLPVPGVAGVEAEYTVNLLRANRPGGGGRSTECTLCGGVIKERFPNELGMRMGPLTVYFNPFSFWPSRHDQDPLTSACHVVAVWGDEHLSQTRLAEIRSLRALREEWMRLNESPRLRNQTKFRMFLNGWNYDPERPENSGGATQDHIHAHWARKPFASEACPVASRALPSGVRVGLVNLLPDADGQKSFDHVALSLEADREHLSELDEEIARALKLITGEKDSFNVLYFEVPAEGSRPSSIRALVTGRNRGVPMTGHGAYGAPQVLGLNQVIGDRPGHFYDLSPEQQVSLEALPLGKVLEWVRLERAQGRLRVRSPEDLQNRYRQALRETAYSRGQVENLMRRIIDAAESGWRNKIGKFMSSLVLPIWRQWNALRRDKTVENKRIWSSA